MTSITHTGAPHTQLPATLETLQTGQVRRFPPLPIADNGKVRLGGQGPLFRPAIIADAGKVRIGGQGPIFR
ncbi:MAG: hypothetical protein JOZ05_05090 [Acetobacteraceae bacterium]|nr:hypothetical protein [Acetobacteraceae bacterium]